MKLRAMVGETEKHEVEVEQGWLGRRKVMVDGDDIIDKWEITSFSKTMRLSMGEEEKHDLRVKFSRGLGGLKIDLYVDGKLSAKA